MLALLLAAFAAYVLLLHPTLFSDLYKLSANKVAKGSLAHDSQFAGSVGQMDADLSYWLSPEHVEQLRKEQSAVAAAAA